MLRLKLFIVITVVFAALTAIAYFPLFQNFEDKVVSSVESGLKSKHAYFKSTYQQIIKELLIDRVNRVATNPNLIEAIETPISETGDNTQLREKVFGEIEAINTVTRAEDFYVTDPAGIFLARNVDFNSKMVGTNVGDNPLVKLAIEGKTQERLIKEEKRGLIWATAAPIKDGDTLLGTVYLGFVVSQKWAMDFGDRINAGFVYFTEDRLITSPFTGNDRAQLAEFIQKDPQQNKYYVLGNDYGPIRLNIGGEDFVGMLGGFKGDLYPGVAGFMVLTSITAELASIEKIKRYIPLVGMLGWLVCALFIYIIVGGVLTPLEKMEQGIYEIISGRHDYQFKSINPTVDGALVQALNVMVATLTGAPLPDEEIAEKTGGWGGVMSEEGEKAPAKPKVAAVKWKMKKPDAPKPEEKVKEEPKEKVEMEEEEERVEEEKKAVEQEEEEPEKEPEKEQEEPKKAAEPPKHEPRHEPKKEAPAKEAEPEKPAAADAKAAEAEEKAAAQPSPEKTAEDYYRIVYESYIKAKKELGEDVSGITLQAFSAKLKENEAALKAKYKCKAVKFQVVMKENQVTLRPLIVKE